MPLARPDALHVRDDGAAQGRVVRGPGRGRRPGAGRRGDRPLGLRAAATGTWCSRRCTTARRCGSRSTPCSPGGEVLLPGPFDAARAAAAITTLRPDDDLLRAHPPAAAARARRRRLVVVPPARARRGALPRAAEAGGARGAARGQRLGVLRLHRGAVHRLLAGRLARRTPAASAGPGPAGGWRPTSAASCGARCRRWARFEYWRAPEKTAAAWRGDLVTVGDLGRVDDDGVVWLDGRREDLVISGGVNVYPAEVEAVLDAHPDVVESAVFGVPDDEWGQRVVAAYVGGGRRRPSSAAWARERLGGGQAAQERCTGSTSCRAPPPARCAGWTCPEVLGLDGAEPEPELGRRRRRRRHGRLRAGRPAGRRRPPGAAAGGRRRPRRPGGLPAGAPGRGEPWRPPRPATRPTGTSTGRARPRPDRAGAARPGRRRLQRAERRLLHPRPPGATSTAGRPPATTLWSYDAVLPAFRRLETDADFGDLPGHGADGPVPVAPAPSRLPAGRRVRRRERRARLPGGAGQERRRRRPATGRSRSTSRTACGSTPPWPTSSPRRGLPALTVRGGVPVRRVLVERRPRRRRGDRRRASSGPARWC